MSAVVPEVEKRIKRKSDERELDGIMIRSPHCFELLLIFSQISGIAMVATGGFVFCTFDVGLHWNNYDAIADEGEGRNNISTHGLLLALGSVFLRGEALLAFRFFRHEPKQVVLCVHFLFYLLSILLPVHGIYSILYNHKSFHGDFHLINAHSWMGIALILANMIHLITGLTAWFSTDKMRGVIMPKQRVFTIGLFLSSVAQLIGAVAQFDEVAYSKCSPKCPIYEEVLLNIFPLCTIIYAAFLVLLLKNEEWRSSKEDKMTAFKKK